MLLAQVPPFYLPFFFLVACIGITGHTTAQLHRPPGISNAAWVQTQKFESQCDKCLKCTDTDFGFEKYQQFYKPLNGTPEHWLHIIVGTIPRRSSNLASNYLTQLLESVHHQLELPGVHLTVFNHRPHKHTEFVTLQKLYSTSTAISFVDLEANLCDPPRPLDWSFHGGLSPVLRARQQTRDVMNMMLEVQDTSRFVLLVEDDFIFCPQALTLMYHKVLFAQRNVQFSAMRFGVGMSGILLWSSDIPLFSQYLGDTQHNMPIDLLATEWFLAAMPVKKYQAMKQRPFIINKQTLVSHIGDVSSFADKRGIRKTAKCGERIRVRSFYEQKESYQKMCDAVEVSPCKSFPKENILKLKSHGNVKPDDIPRTSRFFMAQAGQTCLEGCRTMGLGGFDQCAVGEMNKLNSCGMVKRFVPQCKICIVEDIISAQAHGSDETGYLCVVPTLKSMAIRVDRCNAQPKTPKWQQICVCHSVQAKKEERSILSETTK